MTYLNQYKAIPAKLWQWQMVQSEMSTYSNPAEVGTEQKGIISSWCQGSTPLFEHLSSDPPLKQSEFIQIYQIKTNRYLVSKNGTGIVGISVKRSGVGEGPLE